MVDHGAGGIVQSAQGVHILRVPAAVFEAAGDADLVRRPVEDAGDVLVVDGRVHIPAHRLKKFAVGLAEPAQPCRLKAPQA